MNGVDRSLWARLSPLLDDYLDMTATGRAARLEALRGDDEPLAEALAAMLDKLPAIEREGFLEAPAMPRPPGLDGQIVGAYSLVRELGHGGMGTVWLARRTDGRYEAEVAIKFLRAGNFGHGDAARFQREGSILARLSHPHIARLLDAGVTPDGGQPYLVLEYIDGEPIDQYCRGHALPTAARLQLFLDVLSAVAHAHNRLILHRDLKPSNILVTAAGDVKLLDFGIAKLLDDASGGGAATELTAHAGNAFTPQFAAPEQLQAGDVTTATDVYALGVLLYMLLGGEHPTIGPTGAPLDHMRAVIEVEPRRLSESVLRRGGPSATGSPAMKKLSRELHGDVDTIVARALKKSPAERYANAADLADDIRRFLAHEPIAARPDSRLYRLARFVRRNRAGVATATIGLVAIGAGIGVALWQAREAQAQRVQAEGLIEFMLVDLRKKLQPVGRLDVLDSVGERSLAYYAAQDPDRLDADSLGRRSRALHMIGDLAEQRGRLDEAQKDFQQAADSTAELLARHPDDGQRLFDHSQSEFYLGYMELRRGHLKEAEAAMQRYDALADRMLQIAPTNVDYRLEKIFASMNTVVVLLDLGRPADALRITDGAIEPLAKIVRIRPDEALDNATMYGWRARAHEDLGRYVEALDDEEAKIASARSIAGSESNQEAIYLVANAHEEIARLHLELGQLDQALAVARVSLVEHETQAALDPSNLDWLFELANARVLLAQVQFYTGDAAGARAQLPDCRAAFERLMRTPDPKGSWRIALAGTIANLGALVAANAHDRAAALSAQQALLDDVPRFEASGRTIAASEIGPIAQADLGVGDALAGAGRADDARRHWEYANQRLQPLTRRGEPRAMLLLAQVRLRLGDVQGARDLADKVMATSYRPPALADLQNRIGQAQKSG